MGSLKSFKGGLKGISSGAENGRLNSVCGHAGLSRGQLRIGSSYGAHSGGTSRQDGIYVSISIMCLVRELVWKVKLSAWQK